jgi:hypothetical protein
MVLAVRGSDCFANTAKASVTIESGGMGCGDKS